MIQWLRTLAALPKEPSWFLAQLTTNNSQKLVGHKSMYFQVQQIQGLWGPALIVCIVLIMS